MSAPLTKPHELAAAWRRRVCRVRMPAAAVKVAWSLVFGSMHGISYASQDRLADETGVDRGEVGKLLREMARVELIEAVEPEHLAAAIRADGQQRADRRLVGYRRVIDPGTPLSEQFAAIVTVGGAIPANASIKIAKGKKGDPKMPFVRTIEGDGAPVPPSERIEEHIHLTSGFEGDGAPEFEGDGASPVLSPDPVEADAERVRISPPVIVEVSGRPSTEDPKDAEAGAPDGARLPGRLLATIEEAFGREPFGHEVDRISHLIRQIGRSQVDDRLEAYLSGLAIGSIKRVSLALWLRRAGLGAVADVA